MSPEELALVHEAAFANGRGWSAQEFHDLLANPHTHLTALNHGFALWRAIAGEAEMLTIAVHPDDQNKGIGRKLMQHWTTSAAQLANKAFLEVASDNSHALSLYVASGFTVTATRPAYYGRPNGRADALIMQASLPLPVG